jgi:hypothetical protein
MANFTIKAREFRTNKIDLFKQLQIEKRIALVFPAFAGARAVVEQDPIIAAGYITNALHRLPDDDMIFVINECLAAVQVRQATDMWVDLKTRGANSLQFSDIELEDLHLIVAYVLVENFAPFIAALPSLISSILGLIKKQ